MLYLCRMLYPDILAVFINTGNEHPSILKRIKAIKESGVNLKVIRPKMKPKQIYEKYGFPLVNKETAQNIRLVRINPNTATAKKRLSYDNPYRIADRWRYLLTAPYETSQFCCDKLKKEPAHRFEKETGRHPIIGILASESALRTGEYLKFGSCNVFTERRPMSHPLAIWLEKDIWEFIRMNNIPIADIYSKGVKRTGCAVCGFGAGKCVAGEASNLQLLYEEYPKYYNMMLNYTNNGVTYREALRKQLEVLKQKLPDEQ